MTEPTDRDISDAVRLSRKYIYDGFEPYAPAVLAFARMLAAHRAEVLAEVARLVLAPAEPQPDAPTEVSALPDYWDERRRKQQKPDLSRCAAELRIALADKTRTSLLKGAVVWAQRKQANELRKRSADYLTLAARATDANAEVCKALDELVRLAGGGE